MFSSITSTGESLLAYRTDNPVRDPASRTSAARTCTILGLRPSFSCLLATHRGHNPAAFPNSPVESSSYRIHIGRLEDWRTERRLRPGVPAGRVGVEETDNLLLFP